MIKISFLRSSLHNNKGLDEINKAFIEEIERKLNDRLVVAPIEDYDCDLKLIFIESGGSEGLFLKNIENLKEPYYLLTSGNNNSLAASMEILTYLNLNNKKGEILHGSEAYIAKRIKQIESFNGMVAKLKEIRLGVIGKPSDWLISSIPPSLLLKKKLGISLVNIDINELIDEYHNTDISEYHENIKLEFDSKNLNMAKRMHVAIKKIKEKYNLSGLTVRCFDLLNTCKTTSCLSFGILNSQDIVATCEGDIMAMISMVVARDYCHTDAFQANPSKIDLEKNEILFAHCTIPFRMLESYRLDTHYESGIGVAIKGELKEEDVTIFRMKSDMKHYFVSEGHIIKNLDEKNLCRTQILVKADDDIHTLFTNPCGNHHIIIYGKHKKEIEYLMSGLSFIAD